MRNVKLSPQQQFAALANLFEFEGDPPENSMKTSPTSLGLVNRNSTRIFVTR
jgi:hypothetical protein